LEAIYDRVVRQARSPRGKQALAESARAAEQRLGCVIARLQAEAFVGRDPQQAGAVAEELCRRDAHDLAAAELAARAALGRGDGARASEYLARVVDLAPLAGPDTYLYYAVALLARGDHVAARRVLDAAEPCFPFAPADARALFSEYRARAASVAARAVSAPSAERHGAGAFAPR
ncbi:MAG: hypothetical protein KC503_07955, partial [Myxococcales bacterium]|nr:hypothetical protein [Myxococcales bacterium]